ncbi:hypothetical protein ACQ3G6_08245 [Allorhizobium undicola]|uniref:hypothetical protein n=1 Tax=Allorhizobium undicola TaxID=78527 RepID=UPI000A96C7C4|nr:hypothetical protein [Allorhizobium undicola]
MIKKSSTGNTPTPGKESLDHRLHMLLQEIEKAPVPEKISRLAREVQDALNAKAGEKE